MAIATLLASDHKVTIVARDLPGDEPSIEWASPWAGASFIAGGCSSHKEAKMQIDAFEQLWRWSFMYPESSLVRVTVEDFHDDNKARDQFWWKDFMPEVLCHKFPPFLRSGHSVVLILLTLYHYSSIFCHQISWRIVPRSAHLVNVPDFGRIASLADHLLQIELWS